MRERYGVEHPMQSKEIRARVASTNLERYGAENVFSKEASTFDKVQASMDGKRPVLRGVDNPFAWPEVQTKLRKTMLAKYGAKSPQQVPEIRARTIATSIDRYGAPSFLETIVSLPETLEKVLRIALAKVGKTFPEITQVAQTEEDLIERYGVVYPMQDREYARYALQHPTTVGPNGLERRVHALAPQLLYTGDRTFWRWLPSLGHHKNPDFILPGPDPVNPKKGVTKVVEAFGEFWHSRTVKGKDPFEHEQELIAAYAEVGLVCLVIWESEVKTDPESVRIRLGDFLGGIGHKS
jgi:hypothetical protein